MLVGGFNSTYLKNMLVKLDHFPQGSGVKKYIFELPPPSDGWKTIPASFNLGVGDFSGAFAVKLRGEVFVQLVVW